MTNADAIYIGQKYIVADDNEQAFADDEQGVSFTLAGDALALVQGLYGGDHIPDQPEVFFRLNLNHDPTITPSIQYDRYRIDMADDESSLILQTTEPPPAGVIIWSNPMTLSLSSNQASISINVNTNLEETILFWGTTDQGDSTNNWPSQNRQNLGMQTAGSVTGQLSNLAADTQYFWRFYGESITTSAWSSAEMLVTAFSSDQAPQFISASALSAFSVQLDWQDRAANETAYILQRSTNAVYGYAGIAILPSNTTSYVDTGLSPSTRYYYRLAATNDVNGNSTDFSLCQTDVTTAAVIGGTLTSRDYIQGRAQINAGSVGYYPDGNNGQAGVGGSYVDSTRYDRLPVLGFSLPTLPEGSTLTNAILHFEITEARDHSGRDPAMHVYILDTADPDGSGTNFFYHGPSNSTPEAVFVDETYIDVPDNSSLSFSNDEQDQAYMLSGDALSLLQSFYGGDHIPDQPEVFFRFNHSLVPLELTSSTAYDRYSIDTALDQSSLEISYTSPISEDSDGDGMPDDWEIDNFGSLTNSTGSLDDDQDGDGFSDLHEYLAGTSPTNSGSRLALTSGALSMSTNEMVFTWQAVTGKTYMIISASNLYQTSWMTNAMDIIGAEPSCVHTVVTDQVQMYYRVKLQE
jgi:hypothetical protein